MLHSQQAILEEALNCSDGLSALLAKQRNNHRNCFEVDSVHFETFIPTHLQNYSLLDL